MESVGTSMSTSSMSLNWISRFPQHTPLLPLRWNFQSLMERHTRCTEEVKFALTYISHLSGKSIPPNLESLTLWLQLSDHGLQQRSPYWWTKESLRQVIDLRCDKFTINTTHSINSWMPCLPLCILDSASLLDRDLQSGTPLKVPSLKVFLHLPQLLHTQCSQSCRSPCPLFPRSLTLCRDRHQLPL